MPGTYTFRPIQANLTHDTDWLGKMDPYCSYRIGPERINGPICRNGGKFPKWEDAAVNVPAVNEPSLVVDLLDKDKLLFDDNIGSFVIDLQEVQNSKQISKWYPIYYKQKPAGEILLESAFQSDLVQQPVEVQPQVIVTEKVVPVVVEEKIVKKAPIQEVAEKHWSERNEPIICGISQIHYNEHAHASMPNQDLILNQGSQQYSSLSESKGINPTIISGTSSLNKGYTTESTNIGQHNLVRDFNNQEVLRHQTQPNYQSTQGSVSTTSDYQRLPVSQGGIINQGSTIPSTLNQGTFKQNPSYEGSFNQQK